MKHSIYIKGTYLLLVCLGVLLAGCGANATTGTSASSPTAAVSPTTSTHTSTIWAGTITLRTSALLYHANETISVTITSQSDQTIYFADHQTNCTVILIQRQAVQAQANTRDQAGINPCQLKTPTRIHSLGPGQSLAVNLTAPEHGWPAGVYQATLSYSFSASMTSGPAKTLSTPAFVIGDAGGRP